MPRFKLFHFFFKKGCVCGAQVQWEFSDIFTFRRMVVGRAENMAEIQPVAFGVQDGDVGNLQFSGEQFVDVVGGRAGRDYEVKV